MSRTAPGPTVAARRVPVTEVSIWKLFFTDDILAKILDNTNRNIERYISINRDTINFGKYTYIKRLEMLELKAFIGLIYLRGASKKNLMKVEDVFMHESASDHIRLLCLIVVFIS